jgi:peptide/nickel transport system permease protein
LITTFALIGISWPVFFLGIVLRYFLAEKPTHPIFPDGGYTPLTSDPIQWAYHLILPWFALSVLFIGFYGRVLRSNMLDTMNEDYVRTARAKGVDPRRVIVKHVLRNSLIPIVSLFSLDFAAVIGGGAILTETVFDLKGVGWYAAQSVGDLDLPPIMGVTLYGAFFIVLFSTIADFLYAYLDPRIRPA